MAEMIDRLTRFYCYVYTCRAKSPNKERLWWNGYVEAVEQILKLLKEVFKEEVRR